MQARDITHNKQSMELRLSILGLCAMCVRDTLCVSASACQILTQLSGCKIICYLQKSGFMVCIIQFNKSNIQGHTHAHTNLVGVGLTQANPYYSLQWTCYASWLLLTGHLSKDMQSMHADYGAEQTGTYLNGSE